MPDAATAGGLAARVAHMHPMMFWLAVLAAAGLAAGGFYAAFRFLRRARIMEDTPTSKVRSAAQGYVELSGLGELMPGEPVVAPLTGSHCTWYRYEVDERRERRDADGHTRTDWHTVDKGVSDNLFLLVDDTGSCIVDPEGASVTPSANDTWYGHSRQPLSGPSPSSSGLLASGRYRYHEQRMLPADPLYAIGEFKTVGGAGDLGDAAEEVKALLASWKKDAARMRRLDKDGDGKIDVQEWEAARKAARAQVLKARSERAAQAGTSLMTKPADRSLPYLLSVLPQDGLAHRFRWFSRGGIALFFIAGAIAIWMLGVRVLH